jgi:uncharacterized membrane protein YfcA
MSHETVLVILVAVSIGSAIKGMSGIGLPLVAIPLMAGFIGVERAVALMIVPTLLTNVWQIWVNRAYATMFPNMGIVVVVSIFGVSAGSSILASVPERWLFVMMAAWLGLYLISVVLRFEPNLEGWHGRWPSFVVVFFGGLVQGATGAAGSVLAPYVHALGLRKQAYVFAISVLFGLFGLVQLVTLTAHGILTMDRVHEGLVACIPVAVVMPLAMRLGGRFSVRAFELLLLAVFVLMEARLIYKIIA